MKSSIQLTLFAFVAVILLASCGESYNVPKIEGLAVYQDTVNEMSVKYPKNWRKLVANTKSIRSVTFIPEGPQSMLTNYQNYNIESLPGAYITLTAFALDSAYPLQSKVDKHKKHLAEVATLKVDDNFMIDGVRGQSMTYSFPLNHVEDTMRGFRYFAALDSQTATFLLIETFANTYEEYKDEIAEIVKSLKLAKTPVEIPFDSTIVVQDTFAFPTEEIITTLSGDGFSIGLPDYCLKEKTQSGPGVLSTLHFTAKRHMNCGIRIDVKDGNKVSDIKAQAETNKGLYGGKSPKKTTLAGNDAYKFNYNPSSNVSRTVWYVLHNSKIYIILMDLPKTDKDKYKASMDKAISTLKFK